MDSAEIGLRPLNNDWPWTACCAWRSTMWCNAVAHSRPARALPFHCRNGFGKKAMMPAASVFPTWQSQAERHNITTHIQQ
jgi:hypothetical protein